MKNVANFVLFQLFWFAAVVGASGGSLWAGPLALLVFLAFHLRMLESASERFRELSFALVVGVVGGAADSALRALDLIVYPTSPEGAFVPLWIVSLWVAFALLPRFSLGWLRGRVVLAAVFGAVGGPLSFFAGTRFGGIAAGDSPVATTLALAVEYAVITPLLLRWAPGADSPSPGSRGEAAGSASEAGPPLASPESTAC